jgi:hypothetical protein
MDILLIVAAVTLNNILCFFIGAKVGQKVVKGEPIEMPSLDPMKAIREHQSQKEAERKQERDEVIWGNIERYDGTPYGQRDVPGGE